jgi:hypothetical protein
MSQANFPFGCCRWVHCITFRNFERYRRPLFEELRIVGLQDATEVEEVAQQNEVSCGWFGVKKYKVVFGWLLFETPEWNW